VFLNGSGISCTIMQTISTLLQTEKHTNTSSLNFYRPDAFMMPNQHCQSTEGTQPRAFYAWKKATSQELALDFGYGYTQERPT